MAAAAASRCLWQCRDLAAAWVVVVEQVEVVEEKEVVKEVVVREAEKAEVPPVPPAAAATGKKAISPRPVPIARTPPQT
jgi:hypothetical protein